MMTLPDASALTKAFELAKNSLSSLNFMKQGLQSSGIQKQVAREGWQTAWDGLVDQVDQRQHILETLKRVPDTRFQGNVEAANASLPNTVNCEWAFARDMLAQVQDLLKKDTIIAYGFVDGQLYRDYYQDGKLLDEGEPNAHRMIDFLDRAFVFFLEQFHWVCKDHILYAFGEKGKPDVPIDLKVAREKLEDPVTGWIAQLKKIDPSLRVDTEFRAPSEPTMAASG